MSAKITGSFFPSEDSRMSVKDQTIGDKTKVFISFGMELMAVITEGQARDLERGLNETLRGIEHDREEWVETPGWQEIGITHRRVEPDA